MIKKVHAYEGSEPYVFVSFSHGDKARTLPFIAALQEKANVWFDEGLGIGASWADRIADRLMKCELLVFVAGEASLASESCMDELYFAREIGKPIVIVLPDGNKELPAGFRLRFGRNPHFRLDEFASDAEAAAAITADLRVGGGKPAGEPVKKKEPEKKSEPRFGGASGSRRNADIPTYTPRPIVQSEPIHLKPLAELKPLTGETPEELIELGDRYRRGKGVKADRERAAGYYMRAAEKGSAKGMYLVGRGLLSGDGFPKDVEKGIEWLERSARSGCLEAMTYLGVHYELGWDGLPKDDKKGFEFHLMGAELGDAESQFSVGFCFQIGKGVEKDMAKAAEWYEKAAAQGVGDAQFYLGEMYYSADGVPRDAKRAVELFKKAGEQGNEAAFCYVGDCYLNGHGVPQSEKKAIEYYKKAAELGSDDAVDALADLGIYLDEDEDGE